MNLQILIVASGIASWAYVVTTTKIDKQQRTTDVQQLASSLTASSVYVHYKPNQSA